MRESSDNTVESAGLRKPAKPPGAALEYPARIPGTSRCTLARDTASPYVDNRPLAVAGKPEVREHKADDVLNDEEIGNFSDEVVITCAP